jgi:murein DD-endopeptidase MepM/ murein hydrolase activator NlpD
LQIDSLNLAIKQKESTIAKQKKIVTTLVQHLNAEGNKEYIEILLTNDNFSDFFDKVKYLEKTYIELGASVKALKTAKIELDANKKQVEDKKANLLALKETLDNKKKDIQDQATVKSTLLVQTKSSELKYRTMVESLKQQYAAVENELSSYEQQIKKKLESQNKIADSGNVLFTWPVVSHYITASFEDPEYPFRNVFAHKAIDIRASHGTPVKAAAAGYIGRAKRCTSASCYSYILIVHTGSLSSVYGHLNSIAVTEEQFVNRGDIIGYSGGTPGTVGAGPFVTGPHLHFEVRLNGIPVNPLGYLVQ